MWIGTAAGLYLLNRNTGEYQYIEMEIGITYINTLYQADNGMSVKKYNLNGGN